MFGVAKVGRYEEEDEDVEKSEKRSWMGRLIMGNVPKLR